MTHSATIRTESGAGGDRTLENIDIHVADGWLEGSVGPSLGVGAFGPNELDDARGVRDRTRKTDSDGDNAEAVVTRYGASAAIEGRESGESLRVVGRVTSRNEDVRSSVNI